MYHFKAVDLGFQICYLFREIFKFCNFMGSNNIFRKDHESRNLNISQTYSKFPDHVLQYYI